MPPARTTLKPHSPIPTRTLPFRPLRRPPIPQQQPPTLRTHCTRIACTSLALALVLLCVAILLLMLLVVLALAISVVAGVARTLGYTGIYRYVLGVCAPYTPLRVGLVAGLGALMVWFFMVTFIYVLKWTVEP